jgi:6-phosphogluconolactonase
VPPQNRVFALTNEAAGNAVAVYERESDGSLTAAGHFPTHGLGLGAELNSQGALALSDDGRRLFAVNAGSNDISVFAVHDRGAVDLFGHALPTLRLLSTVPSGGAGPVSLTVRGDLLYVANQYGPGSITGFRVAPDGTMTPVAGSHQPLSGAGASPAQISFTPDGRRLLVTELATDRLVVYQVRTSGAAGSLQTYASAGQTPFGFAFRSPTEVIVSEAAGGRTDASSVSLYRFNGNGPLNPAQGGRAVATHQTGTCWIVVTPDGRFAYASNTDSGTVSGYSVGPNGDLMLLDASGITTDTGDHSRPLDMATSPDGAHLYVLEGAQGAIGAYAIAVDGSPQFVSAVGGLPTGAVGLLAA